MEFLNETRIHNNRITYIYNDLYCGLYSWSHCVVVMEKGEVMELKYFWEKVVAVILYILMAVGLLWLFDFGAGFGGLGVILFIPVWVVYGGLVLAGLLGILE